MSEIKKRKRGRPIGSITTAGTKLENVIRIVAGDEAPDIINGIRQRGQGVVLAQYVDVGILWARERGCVFKAPKRRVLTAKSE